MLLLSEDGTCKPLKLDVLQWHILEDSVDMKGSKAVLSVLSIADDGESLDRLIVGWETLTKKLNSETPWRLKLNKAEEYIARMCLSMCVFFTHDLQKHNSNEKGYEKAAQSLQKKFSVRIPR